MSNHRPTDNEIASMWFEECKRAREILAERQRLDDAMRAAGFATPKPSRTAQQGLCLEAA
jgi:hypothetical protein